MCVCARSNVLCHVRAISNFAKTRYSSLNLTLDIESDIHTIFVMYFDSINTARMSYHNNFSVTNHYQPA